jgi:hypothetical protein
VPLSPEDAVLEHFAAHITDDDRARFPALRQLRNKLLHGEFTVARERLEHLGFAKQGPAISVLKLPELLTVDSLLSAVQTATPFAVDTAPDEGNLLGWHIQSARDGSYTQWSR